MWKEYVLWILMTLIGKMRRLRGIPSITRMIAPKHFVENSVQQAVFSGTPILNDSGRDKERIGHRSHDGMRKSRREIRESPNPVSPLNFPLRPVTLLKTGHLCLLPLEVFFTLVV